MLYDKDWKSHEIKDIIISEKGELNSVQLEFKQPVMAIILNHDSNTYAKIRYDKHTLDNLELNMSKIDDFLTRSLIWRNLWIHVLDCKMDSLKYCQFVVKQLPLETVE